MSKAKYGAAVIILSLVTVISSSVAVIAVSRLNTTENIFTVDQLEGSDSTVSTFKHNGNRCYVVSGNGGYNSGANGISCVRFEK